MSERRVAWLGVLWVVFVILTVGTGLWGINRKHEERVGKEVVRIGAEFGYIAAERDALRARVAELEAIQPILVYRTSMSHYGGSFQGRRMANGQRFDTHKITCAAADWIPMGSILHVRKAGSGDPWVAIPVTDLGDFEQFGREIDASEAAFLAVGAPLSNGVIEVEYWVEKPKQDNGNDAGKG